MTARLTNASRCLSIARLVAAALAAAGPLIARPLAAQAPASAAPVTHDLSWTVELGAVGSTPFVEDGNGVTARAGLGPFLGAALSLAIGDRMALTAGLRGASAAMRLESSGRDWRAGRTHQYDLRVGIEIEAAAVLGIAASAFAARVTGPDDVIPFRAASGRIWTWGAEAAGYVTIARRPYIDVLIAAGVARLGSQRQENPPLAGGWVGQLRLGVRYGLR